MTNQHWDFVFVKVGHYVASKSTKYGESIVLCSDYENLPTQKTLDTAPNEEKIQPRNQNH